MLHEAPETCADTCRALVCVRVRACARARENALHLEEGLLLRRLPERSDVRASGEARGLSRAGDLEQSLVQCLAEHREVTGSWRGTGPGQPRGVGRRSMDTF